MTYQFTPPTTQRSVDEDDPLFKFIQFPVGISVAVHSDGRVTQSEIVDPDDTSVTTLYHGGRTHTITDAAAATLTAAGYGAYLVAV